MDAVLDQILVFIKKRYSIREMVDELPFRSTQSIHTRIRTLVEIGMVTAPPKGTARSYQPTEKGEQYLKANYGGRDG